MHEPAWTFEDARILTAIAVRGRTGQDLTRMMHEIDTIDRAATTEDEAATSLGRLVASGLVTHDGRRFRATPPAARMYRRRSRSQFEQSGSMLRLMADHPLTEARWEFAPGEYQAAEDGYGAEVRRSIERRHRWADRRDRGRRRWRRSSP